MFNGVLIHQTLLIRMIGSQRYPVLGPVRYRPSKSTSKQCFDISSIIRSRSLQSSEQIPYQTKVRVTNNLPKSRSTQQLDSQVQRKNYNRPPMRVKERNIRRGISDECIIVDRNNLTYSLVFSHVRSVFSVINH